jgi:hypothetical protein
MSEREKLLEKFVKKIAQLTLNHGVINDHAVVTARDLGDALETVNPEWWKEA